MKNTVSIKSGAPSRLTRIDALPQGAFFTWKDSADEDIIGEAVLVTGNRWGIALYSGNYFYPDTLVTPLESGTVIEIKVG